MPGRSLCEQHGQELWFRELFWKAAFLKPGTCRACQSAQVSFRLPRVSPGQISKRIKGDYVLSGMQKPQPFAFDTLLGKSNAWFSKPLCSLNCLLLFLLMHGSSLLLTVNIYQLFSLGITLTRGTLLAVACRPRAPGSPCLKLWQCR